MHLLVIDDEPLILETIELTFPDDQVTTCLTAQQGLEAFQRSSPDVVLCDIRLPDMSGMQTIERLHRLDAKIPVILMTGRGTSQTAIEAMQRGAFDYILKPFEPDGLIKLVEEAAETSRIARMPAVIPSASLDEQQMDNDSDQLIGNCPAMQEVYRSIGRVSSQDVTVLILGESGTGKEVIARAIYQYSKRSQRRFLAINCAAIPESLLESELFGHEKGAFTGADRKKMGKFELCSDGTLFLDEIGDMTPLMQTKILRVLQDQTFEPVGSTETLRTNARIVAATNRNLQQAMADKEFRSDLYYRLNVYTIQLPPLRERGDDIALLANYYLNRFAKDLGKEVSGYAPETLNLIEKYHWPGNVRELQSVVKHALLQATGPVIVPAFLPNSVRKQDSKTEVSLSEETKLPDGRLDLCSLTHNLLVAGCDDIHRELIGVAEQKIFAAVLEYTNGNLTQAAKRLGITRTTLRTRLEALGMSVERNARLEME